MKIGNFFGELKRRNVFRAAALYAAGAWLSVQVATQVFPFFHIAEWVVRWIVLASLIGFPFAMLFSWLYEWTPQGLQLESEIAPSESITRHTGKRLDRWIIALLGLAVVLLLTNQFVLRKEGTSSSPPKIPGKSIAVLPFTDLSSGHDQELFSDGMAEEILNALKRIKNLKVIGRASSFHYKGKDVSLPQIGAELGVANVLEGSVRKQGDKIRITTALTRTDNGEQIWSKNYDGTLSNIFDLQETCARDIASELNIVLADVSEKRLVDKVTDNPQAYALFVEAQALVTKRIGKSLPRAIELLEEATELDGGFARAWAKLAVAFAVEPLYYEANWETNWVAAEKAFQRAVTLDPQNAEAYAALGYVEFSRRHYREMVAPAERALELDPKNITANFWAANQLAAMGRTTEMEALLDRALAVDPANGLLVFYKGVARLRVGDNPGALKLSQRADELGYPVAGMNLAYLAAAKRDYEAGAADFARAFSAFHTSFSKQDFATIYRGAYGDEAAHQAALTVVANHPHDPQAATMLLQLGEAAQSFAAFEVDGTGLSDSYYNFLWLPEAWSRKVRQDPAFQDFAKRMGLVDYWKQNRWPDLCQPRAEKDAFTCQ